MCFDVNSVSINYKLIFESLRLRSHFLEDEKFVNFSKILWQENLVDWQKFCHAQLSIKEIRLLLFVYRAIQLRECNINMCFFIIVFNFGCFKAIFPFNGKEFVYNQIWDQIRFLAFNFIPIVLKCILIIQFLFFSLHAPEIYYSNPS